MDTIQEYAHYHLSATLRGGKIKLAATSVTEAHKEKVLKSWQKLGAKDIVCEPVENAKSLPQWDVTYRAAGKCYEHFATITASSEREVNAQVKKLCKGKWHLITKCQQK